MGDDSDTDSSSSENESKLSPMVDSATVVSPSAFAVGETVWVKQGKGVHDAVVVANNKDDGDADDDTIQVKWNSTGTIDFVSRGTVTRDIVDGTRRRRRVPRRHSGEDTAVGDDHRSATAPNKRPRR